MASHQNEVTGDEVVLRNGFWKHYRVAKVAWRSYLESPSAEEGTFGTQQ